MNENPRRRRRERPVLSTPIRTVAVVGASLAGLSAVEALRNLGYDGRIVVVGGEDALPYDRPPLSKQVLAGTAEPDRTALRSPAAIERLGADWRLGRRAAGLDLERRAVLVSDGEPVPFDGLVIATGASPRRIPHPPALAGIHVLRTLSDCLALRAELDGGPRVAVVGAGFIGAEVAATARSRGLEVDLVEAFPTPLANSLGPEAGAWCGQLHVDHGVRLHCGVTVTGFDGVDRVEAVRLSDGRVVPADVVVVGAGVVPETGWLEGSGLRLENGVVCDEYCRATAPGVVAAGDVARWSNPLFDEVMRVEHWTNAVEQGEAAARNLVVPEADRVPYAPVPYFWSDQYDVKIQFCGRARPDDGVQVVHGSVADREFVAVFARQGRLTGALAFNCGREFAGYQRLIARRPSLEEAMTHIPA
ncbi:MAG TPA: FAD/NAD(P)-binding oxidoreductase [Acidimicrobiia bacterium]|nr:FAD/NAD(P)-binding oxidoreductase [Acidimicrobiia bacterium]